MSQTVYRDLTAHPYAGLPVEITLEANDAAGNIGRSKPVRFTLPARVFTNPLARALVEQRQNLSLDGAAGRNTACLALDALTLAPEVFYQNATGRLLWRCARPTGRSRTRAVRRTSAMCRICCGRPRSRWSAAVFLRGGRTAPAAADDLAGACAGCAAGGDRLAAAALSAGAEQIPSDAGAEPAGGRRASPKGAKVLRPQDLQALLRAIQQLAQTGARGQAQQLLAMLQNLLENLHMTAGAGGSGGQGDKALSDALKGLGDLMGKQRQLLDKTFRQQQGNPDPKDGGPQGLAQQQGTLRQQLDKLTQGLGPKAGSSSKDLGDAGKQMGNAQGQLGNKALDNATGAERNALDAMRKGAGKLANEMMKDGSQQQRESGNEDPLGRENGGNGSSYGDQTKLPDKSQLARARNILQELRRRAEERGRPQEELDYIDRLLKQF